MIPVLLALAAAEPLTVVCEDPEVRIWVNHVRLEPGTHDLTPLGKVGVEARREGCSPDLGDVVLMPEGKATVRVQVVHFGSESVCGVRIEVTADNPPVVDWVPPEGFDPETEGFVRFDGDAYRAGLVPLEDEAQAPRFGVLPAGSYRVMADFGQGYIRAGNAEIEAGKQTVVDCQSLMRRCGVQGARKR